MHNIRNIRFKGYKVFSDQQYVSVENLSPVNVIIGKNNSGKTSLLDILETIFASKANLKVGFDVEDIQFDLPFDSYMVNSVFSGGLSGIGRWDRTTLTDYTKDKLFPFSVKIGDKVEEGEILGIIHANDEVKLQEAVGLFEGCFEICDEFVGRYSEILGIMS